MASGRIEVRRLGAVPYREALALQAELRACRQADEIPDTLLLLEHPPVYTRGRRSTVKGTADRPALDGELPLGEDFYHAQGIEIVPTDRGGRVTYHGPGQLVGYPIMRVNDVGVHLRTMEAAIVAALADYGIEARSRWEEGIDYTGVWVQDRKIASIGVHLSRGVSTHGFAVNVTNDLEPFSWIVPCGLDGVAMTSLERELGREPAGGIDAFAELMAQRFCEAHACTPVVAAGQRAAHARDLAAAYRLEHT
ncbi:MAG TPA: lipoyl(octanoyl) transferase LipB [Solirubrobacteraceae bacterium]|nr:lipoyl(octanoyl) transferase LipB [Solirubrobacteraceae bacterium]